MSSSDDGTEMSSDDYDFSNNGDHLNNHVINNKYLLLKKIGYGSFSSVWFVLNWQDKKYYAMKIYNDEDYEEGIGEIRILKNIKKLDCKYLMTMIDYFIYETKTIKKDKDLKLRHPCIVFELMVGSLYELGKFHYNKEGIPIKIIDKIYPQIMEGIKTLHEKMEIIHADIKPENILIRGYSHEIEQYIKYINSLDLNILLEEKKSYQLVCEYINKRLDMINIDDQEYINQKYLDNIEICITDFGSIIPNKKFSTDEIQTRYYRAPEILLQLKHGFPCDIWAIGCMLFELITGLILFDPDKDDIRDRDYCHILLIVNNIGKIPKYMIDSSPVKRLYFQKYKLKFDEFEGVSNYIVSKLKEKIKDSILEKKYIEIILNMLVIEPNKRNFKYCYQD
jgi:serine/threonine-protein kinase SRPK3